MSDGRYARHGEQSCLLVARRDGRRAALQVVREHVTRRQKMVVKHSGCGAMGTPRRRLLVGAATGSTTSSVLLAGAIGWAVGQ